VTHDGLTARIVPICRFLLDKRLIAPQHEKNASIDTEVWNRVKYKSLGDITLRVESEWKRYEPIVLS